MNILQINKFYHEAGGADQYMIDLSKRLAACGHTVVPFAMDHPKNLHTPWSRFFPSNVETEHVIFSPRGLKTFGRMVYSYEAQRNLEKLLRVFRPDVAHVHNIYHQLSPSILRTLAQHNIPVVMTVHDHKLLSPLYALTRKDAAELSHPFKHSINIIRNRRLKHSIAASSAVVFETAVHRVMRMYESIRILIAPSVTMKNLLAQGGYAEDRIRVVPHCVEQQTLGVVPRKNHFVYVGRLKSEKGCDTLLQALRHAQGLQVKIIGAGPDEQELRAYARKNKLSNVTFLGAVPHSDVARHMAEAQAVIVPSRVLEPFGSVALEAMSVGTPVIAANIGALAEHIEDKRTGLLFEPENEKDLARQLTWASAHPCALRTFGEQTQTQAQTCTPEKHLHDITDIYELVSHQQ